MLEQGKIGVTVVFLVVLAIIFIGMAITFLNMAQGRKNDDLPVNSKQDSAFAVIPPLALGILTLILGLYIPPAVNRLLHDVAVIMGGY